MTFGCIRTLPLILLAGCGASPTASPTPVPAERTAHLDRGDLLFIAMSHHRFVFDDGEETRELSQQLRWRFSLRPGAGPNRPSVRLDSLLHLEGAGLRPEDWPGPARTPPESSAWSPTRDLLSRWTTMILPSLPVGGASPGSHWSDTSTVRYHAADLELALHAVTAYEASAWSDSLPGATLRVTWRRALRVTGSGTHRGAAIEVRGEGSGAGWHEFGSAGVYLGSMATDTTFADVTIPALGMTLELLYTTADSVVPGEPN